MASSVKQIKDQIINVYKQMSGMETTSEISLSDVVDGLRKSPAGFKEKMFNELYERITDIKIVDNKSFKSDIDSIGLVNSDEWMGIIEFVNFIAPEIRDNSAWNDFVSGTVKLHDTPVVFPTMKSGVGTIKGSWSQPWGYTERQLQKATVDGGELVKLVSEMDRVANENVEVHKHDLARTNLLNFFASKKLASDIGTGIHMVDIVKKYYGEIEPIASGTTKTVEDFLADPKAKNWFVGYRNFICDFMKEPTVNFALDAGKPTWVVDSDLVSVFNSQFEQYLRNTALSDVAYTSKNGIDRVGRFYEVPYWQNGSDDTFDTTTGINVKLDWYRDEDGKLTDTKTEKSVELGNVAGACFDERCLLHTYIHEDTATDYDPFKKITAFERQIEDSRICLLQLNGVLFVMNDYTAE